MQAIYADTAKDLNDQGIDFKKGKIAFVAENSTYYVGTDLTAEPGTVWIDKDGNATAEIPAGGQPTFDFDDEIIITTGYVGTNGLSIGYGPGFPAGGTINKTQINLGNGNVEQLTMLLIPGPINPLEIAFGNFKDAVNLSIKVLDYDTDIIVTSIGPAGFSGNGFSGRKFTVLETVYPDLDAWLRANAPVGTTLRLQIKGNY